MGRECVSNLLKGTLVKSLKAKLDVKSYFLRTTYNINNAPIFIFHQFTPNTNSYAKQQFLWLM